MTRRFCLVACVALSLCTQFVTGAEPGWSPVVIARGEYREQIKSQPIEQRPYRPFHFYGNTVRRQHHRGNPLPMPRDLAIVRPNS